MLWFHLVVIDWSDFYLYYRYDNVDQSDALIVDQPIRFVWSQWEVVVAVVDVKSKHPYC